MIQLFFLLLMSSIRRLLSYIVVSIARVPPVLIAPLGMKRPISIIGVGMLAVPSWFVTSLVSQRGSRERFQASSTTGFRSNPDPSSILSFHPSRFHQLSGLHNRLSHFAATESLGVESEALNSPTDHLTLQILVLMGMAGQMVETNAH